MRNTGPDLRAMLVEAKIDDLRREAARRHLVERLQAAQATEHDPKRHLVKRVWRAFTSVLWLAFFWRRAGQPAQTGRERASQPKTRSQSMQVPSGTA